LQTALALNSQKADKPKQFSAWRRHGMVRDLQSEVEQRFWDYGDCDRDIASEGVASAQHATGTRYMRRAALAY
jgi:hypothetical protein